MTRTLVTCLALFTSATLVVACGSPDSKQDTGGSSQTGSGGSGGGGGGGPDKEGLGGGGGAGGGGVDFSCIGSVVWGKPTAATVTSEFRINDAESQGWVAGANVKACAKDDATCAKPLATGTTSNEGKVSVTVPTGTSGFDGYLYIESTSEMPTLLYPSRPIIEDGPRKGIVISKETFGKFAPAPVAGRGHIAIMAFDCAGATAAGVKIAVSTADNSSLVTYFDGQAPGTKATETFQNGAAIVFNVPAGLTMITATVAATGNVIGTYELLIREGHMSERALEPMPKN